MKRLLSFLLLLTGIVFADDRYPFAGGAIAQLDATTKQIAIKTGSRTNNFTVTDQTYLINGTEKLSFDKLKVGDPVKLNYYTNETGQAIIRRLKIDHPGPAEMEDKTQ